MTDKPLKSKRKHVATKHAVVRIYNASLTDANWYLVFAKSRAEALAIVRLSHYPDLTAAEFRRTLDPSAILVPDDQKILVNDEINGQQNWPAKRWAKHEASGLFCSNTYET